MDFNNISLANNQPLYVCNVDEEGRFGGPERRIVQVAKHLHRYGVTTHILYPNFDSDKFSDEIKKAEILSTSMQITRLSKERKILLRYLFSFWVEILRLALFFKKNKFDLVHVNGSYQFKVAIASKLAGTPSVWHLNDTSMKGIIKIIFKIVGSFCADGFIVAGQRVQKHYLANNSFLSSKPMIEIHAPVDLNVFNPDIVKEDSHLAKVDGRKIVTVSSIIPVKGVEYFIEMAARLSLIYQDIKFFIAGGELSSQHNYAVKIKHLIRKKGFSEYNFHMLGMVDNVPAVLKGADVVAFTSVSEASPSVVWEAMAMGKAIVTTDVGSVGQYIKNGESGFIVPVKDVNALVEKVKLLLENDALRKKMGANARMVVEKELNVQSAAEKHAAFYRKIVLLAKQRVKGIL